VAGTSLLALLDDIASILDDVAILTKVAAKKTAGVLGDDLALNAEQVTGVSADRELPVVWAVAKGSALNKLILVPAALGITLVAPWAIVPLLMLGGLFLCFEGFEKVAHKLLTSADDYAEHHAALAQAAADTSVDLVAFERDKIKGAIRTDFILSAEIIVIALGTVTNADWPTRIGVLVAISTAMTVGVYGLVAVIVKLDDVGLHLSRKGGGLAAVGRGLLVGAPWLMKALSVVGTAAMFLVGGGILVHGIPGFEAWANGLVAGSGAVLETIASTLVNAVVGVVAGGLAVLCVQGAKRLLPGRKST
jgi:predicted DNA repair protein MutK